MIYTVINNNDCTNWKVGARIRRLETWSRPDANGTSWALFTDAQHEGVAVNASSGEVAAVSPLHQLFDA